MLHHHGGAGSPYAALVTVDNAVQFSLPPPPTVPVSFTSIPRSETQMQPAGSSAFAELPLTGGAANNLHDDDDMSSEFGASWSTVAGASGSGGSNRWSREETLALIRIRSEMDAAFQNTPLKAPLWEDVSRKLAALGYVRSAKKCKEKFENVDKYYRRTKEARAGRQDGKSYRFFSELEALHAAAPQKQAAAQADPQPSEAMAWTAVPATLGAPVSSLPGLSFSSISGSESESDDEFEFDDKEDIAKGDGGDNSECDREMMALFEGMMSRVTEKQGAMQRVFLDTLEKWEAERTAREEAWRRQEVARMNREREQLAKERAAAASRDAALIAFLQRVGGRSMPDHASPSPRQDISLQVVPLPPKPDEAWAWAWAGGESSGGRSTLSRWPKEEVQALIQLRTEKDEQYHDTGSKGPLWEDIAAGMRRIGYNRSAKRCKEKWENINKYFKKVKESNKRRPEDSKTCSYFHQLDAMYRRKRFAGRPGSSGTAASGAPAHMTAATASGHQASPSQCELEGKSSNDVGKLQNIVGVAHVHPLPGNSETAPATTSVGGGARSKKAEDTARETNVQLQRQQEFAAEETDSDDDVEGNYTDEGNGGDRMQSAPAPTETAAAVTSSAPTPTSTTFLAVQ